ALILGIYPRWSALIVSGMLLGFIIAQSINFIRGHEFDCGCFSVADSGEKASPRRMIFRDVILFLLGLHVLFYNNLRRWCIRER
ncbi:MAG: hypothetical protein JRJ29_14560, partial [Deltaproteobacteria bacterium]|nr:hypothetical protein [Deltaproteobacteria bacterium]